MAPKQPVAGPSRIKASSVQAPPPPSAVSAFSPSGSLYACAQPVLGSADKLVAWDIASDRVIADFELDGAAKATTVNWTSLSGAGPSKKKRRKSEPNGITEEALVVSTGSGALLAFSPRRGERTRQLEIGPVTAGTCTQYGNLFATSKELLYVDSDLSEVTSRFDLPSGTHVNAIALLPTSTRDKLYVLLGATSTILHLHLDTSTGKISHSGTPLPVSTTSVVSIHPLPPSQAGTSFLVVSQGDRTVSQYTLSSPNSPAKLSYRYTTPTLSFVHSLSLSPTLLSVVHYSGEISLFTLPTELDLVRPKSGQPSTVRIVTGKDERLVTLCGAIFDEGSLLCGRLVGGGRVKWIRATYELSEGGIRPDTLVKADAQDLIANGTSENVQTQRFAAPTTIEVPAQDNAEPASTLPADVDMADLSLGERLLALPNGDTAEKAAPTLNGPVNAASLTRLLVQALHTSDPALLNLVLTHRDPVLIRNTIRKLPPTLALPLLKACIERLGQGKGVNSRGGGRGVGQNEQQARGTIQWVKGCLIERSSMLQTMPSLAQHLGQLSSLLQERMRLYQPLQTLSGRLDLALSQIEIRRLAESQAPQAQSKGHYHYIEGQSSDSEDDDEVHVEVGDGDGEVEDVDMRVNDDSGSEEESDDDDPLESGSDDDVLDLDAEDGIDESDGSAEDDD